MTQKLLLDTSALVNVWCTFRSQGSAALPLQARSGTSRSFVRPEKDSWTGFARCCNYACTAIAIFFAKTKYWSPQITLLCQENAKSDYYIAPLLLYTMSSLLCFFCVCKRRWKSCVSLKLTVFKIFVILYKRYILMIPL